MRSLASAENVVRKGGFRENFSLPPSETGEDENLEDAKRAVVPCLLRNGRRIIFHFVLFKVACTLLRNRKQGNRNESLIYRGYISVSRLAKETSNLQSFHFHNRKRVLLRHGRLSAVQGSISSSLRGVTLEESRSRDLLLDNVTDNRWRFEPRGSYHGDTGAMSSA